jgi:hypothetical protein
MAAEIGSGPCQEEDRERAGDRAEACGYHGKSPEPGPLAPDWPSVPKMLAHRTAGGKPRRV